MLTDRFIKSIKPGEKEKFIADFDGLYITYHNENEVVFGFNAPSNEPMLYS